MGLLEKANKIYLQNFKPITHFGRCIFLSWYCDKASCKFCFRFTLKHKSKYKERRSLSSILTDAIIGKNFNWQLEFLTGGYKIFPFKEILRIVKYVSQIYQQKIWINLGTLTNNQLNQLKPYVEGVYASIETTNEKLHNYLCPDKPIKPYSDMLKQTTLKKAITIVIGLGENKQDIKSLHKFIKEHNLDRITFYALKPVKGTIFKKSPEPEYYAYWIAKTRIAFPKLEIIAGLTPQKVDYLPLILKAGINTITKFPIVRKFNSEQAKYIEEQIKLNNRTLIGSLTKLQIIDIDKELKPLNLEEETKQKIKVKLQQSLDIMRKSKE